MKNSKIRACGMIAKEAASCYPGKSILAKRTGTKSRIKVSP